MPQSRSKLVFKVVGIALASLVACGIAVSIFALLFSRGKHFREAKVFSPSITTPNYAIPVETWTIHGKGKSPETHVPFRLDSYGGIFVKAQINGKPIECQVDTGCPGILWNAKLALTDQRTGFKSHVSDAVNHPASIQEALLNRVQVGGLELRQIPSEAVVSAAAQTNRLPLLGNSVFAHTVLTIDYAKRELVIRLSRPSDKLVAESPNGCVLDFQSEGPNVPGRFGRPYIRGGVMSLPTYLMVDTGWSTNTVGLTRAFYSRVHAKLKGTSIKISPGTASFPFGKTHVTYLSHVFMSFGKSKAANPGIGVTNAAIIIDDLGPNAQAVFGYSVLRHFKATIDYPHQRIRFEPI